MRKYFAVARILFKAQMVYRFDVAFSMVAAISQVLFAWILWGAIFAGRHVVEGFTFPAMFTYYLMVALLGGLDLSNGVSREVSERIRGGTFTKYMVVPAGVQRYFIFQTLGAAAYYGAFGLLAMAFCALAFPVGLEFASDPLSIVLGLALVPPGLVFMISYHYFVGILTLKFQDIGFFRHVQGSIIAFVTGALVPLTLLPGWVSAALGFLPFPHVLFTPAMLLIGKAKPAEGLFALGVLLCWTAVMLVSGKLMYNRLRVRYDGVGI